MARKIPTPAKTVSKPLPSLPVAATVKDVTESGKQLCGNCKCFVSTDLSTGKGKCTFFPPNSVLERDASLEDPEGKRWPICWEKESCYQWVSK